MSGSIVRALNWDEGYEQQFIGINPIGDEVILYQTNHEDPSIETNDMLKVTSRTGFDNIQCLSYSYFQKGLLSVGQINGNISIFDITAPNSPVLRLKPKQGRPCNSLSFNNGDLIVAGFDKGRQDNSLQIWNIEHYSRTGNNDHIKRPTQTYIPNEAVLSTIFYPDQQYNLLCGSYKYLREIDLRSDQPSFQMATKCTLGLNIDPFQTHLFSSLSEDGSVAIWDKRKLTGSNSSKHNIVTEQPVLYFNKLLESSRKNSNPCFRYSTIRKGEFSSVFSGELIRRWQTGVVPDSAVSDGDNSVPVASQPENSSYAEAALKDTKDSVLASLKAQSRQLYKPNEDSLFVSMVLDVKPDFSRVVSFDYSPDLNSATSTNFVCMRQSGSVFRMPVVECIESMDFNSYNEFLLAGPEGTMTKFLKDPNDLDNQQNSLLNRVNDFSLSNNDLRRLTNLQNATQYAEDLESTVDGNDDELDEKETDGSNKARRKSKAIDYDFDQDEDDEDDEEDSIPLNTFLDVTEVITNDICATIRKRASLGYGNDCEKNIRVLESIDNIDNQLSLRNTWKWLSLAKKSLDKGTMVSQGIDLGFLGVLGILNGIEKLTNPNRFSKDIGSFSDQFFSSTVKSIVASKGKKAAAINIPSDSEQKAQRKLCLIVSGWYFSDEEFDERLNILVSLGFYEKAAGWAVFHGHVDRAVEILSSSKKERLRLMATAIAGYLAYKNSNVNSPWKDQCRKMASELDNPYLRAIFAFIADNDWWDVLDEHSLPLRERLGVALRFLSDKDLTVYLNRIADTVVSKGELEGLILTGITARGIDLIQSYVDRTSDVQTAALMASFGSPRYLVDKRIDHWIDGYRDLLNSWGMFKVRAKFDVARTKLSKTKMGVVTLKPAPKQVYLQCPKCNKNLSKTRPNGNLKTPNNAQALIKQFNKLSYNKEFDIKSCTNCGAQLPRCSVCLLSLGTPVPFESSEKLMETTKSSLIENRFREWFSFCLNCNHGCHAFHAEEWFSKHYVCPVPDCNCRCNSL